jgi:hypothetical protein
MQCSVKLTVATQSKGDGRPELRRTDWGVGVRLLLTNSNELALVTGAGWLSTYAAAGNTNRMTASDAHFTRSE